MKDIPVNALNTAISSFARGKKEITCERIVAVIEKLDEKGLLTKEMLMGGLYATTEALKTRQNADLGKILGVIVEKIGNRAKDPDGKPIRRMAVGKLAPTTLSSASPQV